MRQWWKSWILWCGCKWIQAEWYLTKARSAKTRVWLCLCRGPVEEGQGVRKGQNETKVYL